MIQTYLYILLHVCLAWKGDSFIFMFLKSIYIFLKRTIQVKIRSLLRINVWYSKKTIKNKNFISIMN